MNIYLEWEDITLNYKYKNADKYHKQQNKKKT
jgi:hypothetical protein